MEAHAFTSRQSCRQKSIGTEWRSSKSCRIVLSLRCSRSDRGTCCSAPTLAKRRRPQLAASAVNDEKVASAAGKTADRQTGATLDSRQQEDEFRQGLLSTTDFDDDLAGACDLGLPDFQCTSVPTPPPIMSSVKEAFTRGRWLLGLLVLQSTSSMVLDKYEVLLKDHLFVTLFLTMLVGAGGNAGNQSAIKIIRGLATGALEPTSQCMLQSLRQQGVVALMLGTGLSVGGFARVWLSTRDLASATAITASLLMIVVVSIVVGTVLPYAMAKAKLDPAHAGTTIQVVMDVSGVAITCATCSFVMDQLAASLAII